MGFRVIRKKRLNKIKNYFINNLIVLVLIMLPVLPAYSYLDMDSLLNDLNKEGLTFDDYQQCVTYYYLNPDPDKLIRVFKADISNDYRVTDVGSFMAFKHFIATVAYNDEKFLEKLKGLEGQYSGVQQEAIQKILKHLEDYESPLPDCAIHLDYLWVEFMATGDEKPVKKIIDALNLPYNKNKKNPTDRDLDDAITKYSAKWSLRSNAEQHKKVLEIIEKEAQSAKGPLKKELEEILSDVSH